MAAGTARAVGRAGGAGAVGRAGGAGVAGAVGMAGSAGAAGAAAHWGCGCQCCYPVCQFTMVQNPTSIKWQLLINDQNQI